MTAAGDRSARAQPSLTLARPRRRARATTVTLALSALLAGLVLGLGSADWATSRGFPLGAVRLGPWTSWPRAGAASVDPYTRAVLARTGALPLGIGEGLAFEATSDDERRPLDAACRYGIGRAVPQARAWTLSVYGDGQVSKDALRRSGFTSAEILREQDGAFAITLAAEPRPGNWLPMPQSGAIRLVLRLYDTPAVSVSGTVDARAMPAIERLDCAS